ncbi:DUF4905 domain-containing protein [Dyadobacter psychrotolerans]|uniref:DUF4905 domain-containing protein n=1 Tax=Dyadobacter psychrotolerans TaxID=2541721 RepID=UPI0014052700|nr:DUF4905 domain-containing protein [Dyadobacter psychrotolerans]
MQKLFSHNFSQNIWRILPDPDPHSDLWAIELRDASQKKVSFAMVDLSKPEVRWQAEPEATDWWTSLTAFSFNHLFLHNYRYPDIPEPTDLLMVSAQSGQMQWVLPNHLLVKTVNQELIEVATKAGDQFKYFLCSAETGLRFQGNEDIIEAAEQIILGEPVRYMEGNPYFDRLAAFISEHTFGQEPVAIDYLEKRPYMMFSYYLYEQEKMAAYLLIMTTKSELVLHEKLSEGRDGIGQSSMFLKGSKLVFLKNNNEFSSLTLY